LSDIPEDASDCSALSLSAQMLVPHSIHQNQITLPFEVNDEIVVELPVRFRLFVLFTHALLSIVYCHQEKNLI